MKIIYLRKSKICSEKFLAHPSNNKLYIYIIIKYNLIDNNDFNIF